MPRACERGTRSIGRPLPHLKGALVTRGHITLGWSWTLNSGVNLIGSSRRNLCWKGTSPGGVGGVIGPVHSYQGRVNAHIFWDMDNLRPLDIDEAMQLSELLVDYVSLCVSGPVRTNVTAFGNDVTILSLVNSTYTYDSKGRLDEAVRGQVVETCSKRKQSVDSEMKQSMVEFARQKDSLNVIACVSDDKDFVSTLRYCSSLPNCETIAFGRFSSHKRPRWAHARSLRSLPLPSSVKIAVSLRREHEKYDIKGCSQRMVWRVVNTWCNPVYSDELY